MSMRKTWKRIRARLCKDKQNQRAIRSDGVYETALTSKSGGILTIALRPDEPMMERYTLLLQESGGRKRQLDIKGVQNEDVVRFDLSSIAVDTLWTGVVWQCYLFGESGDVYFTKRLCQEGSRDWNNSAQIDGSFSTSCLWRDSERCVGKAAGYLREGTDYSLLFLPDVRTNALNLQWFPDAHANLLLSDKVWHHAGNGRKPEYPYQFSVVMPVYNTQNFIREAIDSVLAQDIGFKENVQLILVDDGSTDDSGVICDEYAEKYPYNIVVIHKKNEGAASARNEGKKAATGKYVNFMDSDDLLTADVLGLVQKFFDQNYDRTDIVTIPMFYFGERKEPHWQNYKFEDGSRVINLWKEPSASCMSAASSFYKKESLRKYEFDLSLPSTEDCKMNLQILMNKMSLGVVAEGAYWYRRRNSKTSLINTKNKKKSYYDTWFSSYVFEITESYRERFGFVPVFVQNTIMMDLQWRFREREMPEEVLTPQEIREYREKIIQTIRLIDDNVILTQKKLFAEHFIQIFCMKYGIGPTVQYAYNNAYVFCGKTLLKAANNMRAYFDFIRLKKDVLHLEGYMLLMGFPEDSTVELYVSVHNNYYLCENVNREFSSDHNCFGKLKEAYGFSVDLPIMPLMLGEKIRMNMVIDGHLIVNHGCSYGQWCPVTSKLDGQYCYLDQSMVLLGEKDGLVLERPQKSRMEYEDAFVSALKKTMREQEAENKIFPQPVMPDTLTTEKYEEIVRLRKATIKAKKNKPIWLVFDRLTIADDNGAALFQYLMKQENLPADVYFVMKKECPDFKKMAEIGPVLDWGSEEYLKMYLIAEMIISSSSENYIYMPFGKGTMYYGDYRYYRDLLYNQKFVFLQHGITKDNVTKQLQRYWKNFSGFVTTAWKERESILTYPYYYSEEEVWLTGLPRLDRLYEDSKKRVTLMPTWRSFLKGCDRQQFLESEFYMYYKELINSPLLCQVLQEHGYSLCIKLHPEMLGFEDLFEELGVDVLSPEEPYRKIYAESDLIITDYSSASFDFSYMRKPVVYFQFDKEKFFAEHYALGYFSYEEDGFGPVVTTADEAVEEIVAMIEDSCRIKQKYLDRCNAFFPENDYHNCERVYRKILELQTS